MDDSARDTKFSRRTAIAGAGALAGCASMGTAEEKQVKTELEIANETLVNNFCLDWAKQDIDLLAEYFADDMVYQMFEGQPDITSKEEFKQKLGPFIKNLSSVEWIINRSYVIGELVINDRIDHFNAENEEKSMHFAIQGFFLVRDGKIKIWRDYSLPGGITQVGSAVGPA
jgi:limonene-1,2-epoxide hydrolase